MPDAVKQDTKQDVIAVVDPYTEPLHPDDFAAGMLAIYGDTDLTPENMPIANLFAQMNARIYMLEQAMLPFAVQATMMANAQITMRAAGKTGPGGGTWITTPDNIKVSQNEALFYNLVDILGRDKAQAHMEAILKTVQDEAKLKAELAAHTEGGGKLQ